MSGRVTGVQGKEAFRALARSHQRARSGPVTVHFCAAGDGVSVAYSVGRKIGGAVVRNQWRRRLRGIVAEAATELEPGAYLIALAPDVVGLHFDELRKRVINTMHDASREMK